MRRIALALLLAVIVRAGWADEPDYGSVGARSFGMASIRTTMRGDGATLFGNPSLLTDLAYPVLFLDASQGALVGTLPLGRLGSVAVGAADLTSEDRFLLDRPWNPFGTFRTGRNRATIGYAFSPHPGLNLGFAVDGWRDESGQWAEGLSAGMLLRPTELLHFGVEAHRDTRGHWQNRYGLLIRPDARFQIRAEAETDQLALGVESVWKYASFRAGLRFATQPAMKPSRAAFGVSAHLGSGVLVHYGYQFDAEDFRNGAHRVSLDIPIARWGRTRSPVASGLFPGRPSSGNGSQTWRPSPRRLVVSAVDRRLDIPSSVRGSLRRLIEHHAAKYGVEVPLILAIMRAESSFNPRAVSSSKAVGLFQLLPAAARDMGIRLRDRDVLNPARDPRFDPIINADAGIRYFAHLLQRFGWNYVLAIAAYNAGPSTVTDDVPRRRETERHVGKVLNYYYEYKNDPSALKEAWRRVAAAGR